jgi:methionyl-tRNA formyltransferase
MKIILLTKTNHFCRLVKDFCVSHFDDLEIYDGERGKKNPEFFSFENYSCDYLISFLSPWIVPKNVLDNVNKAAINFHPAPPEYPGIGCYNFALYDEVEEYGSTCHYMKEKVDTGEIISVKKFPVLKNETVHSLKEKTLSYMVIQFYEVVNEILNGNELPSSNYSWQRKPYTRKELNDLCEIKLDMNEDEIKKRIKATYYPDMPGPYVFVGGKKFELNNKPV